MKKLYGILFVSMFSASVINAQKSTLPDQGSGKQKLAEITVPSIELISAVKDDSKKAFIINVKIEIMNSGQTVAPDFILIGLVKKGNAWKALDNNFKIQSIKTVSSKTSEYKFIVPYLMQTGDQFEFKVQADIHNTVKEMNENNNSSVGILIGL